jgi:hypothetical protein
MAIFAGTERLGLPSGATDAKDKKIADPAKLMALIETKPEVPPTHVMLRGLAANKGEEVSAAVPVVLTRQPLPFPKPNKTSLRRRTLAEWVGAPENPLTWRVMVNRVWQHHFGAGLVITPSNFGFSGAKPSHPELLDWLAGQFIASGGKLKPLHKLMLMSATYRQQSRLVVRASARDSGSQSGLKPELQTDPSNTLLTHMNKQRMEAEVIRDAVLAVSGKLNRKPGGSGIKPRIRAELLDASQRNKWPVLATEGAEHWRRSVYIYVKRQLLMPSLELFDAPTTTDSCALRTQSTVPTQSLVMMNDEFIEEQAGYLARRAKAEAGETLPQIVERLFLLTLARRPTDLRLQQSLEFLQSREQASDKETALKDLAHVLLNSSEFVYIE